jgi:cytochrome d ubiquinol oxidase subunit II
VLFAAFPLAYASLFSGFYVAFMLVLLVMILRTVAIEFRSKRTDAGWRRSWDAVFSLSSLGLALLLGVAFGNIIRGVNLNEQGDIHESLIDLLNPYALLVGVTAISMFAVHGSLFLTMKTEGELHQRVRRFLPGAMAIFFVLTTLLVLATAIFEDQEIERYTADIWPVIVPAAALLTFVLAGYFMRNRRDFQAFISSAAMIALLIISGAIGIYPNLLVSSTNEQYNLTIDNAASADNTLTVMLIVAAIGMPLVLLYTAGIYYFFRGKTALGPDSY